MLVHCELIQVSCSFLEDLKVYKLTKYSPLPQFAFKIQYKKKLILQESIHLELEACLIPEKCFIHHNAILLLFISSIQQILLKDEGKTFSFQSVVLRYANSDITKHERTWLRIKDTNSSYNIYVAMDPLYLSKVGESLQQSICELISEN